MHVRLAGRGQQIIDQSSENERSVFFLLDGTVKVEVTAPNGWVMRVTELRRGDLFGDLAALDEDRRSASVVAVTNCRLATLPSQVFLEAVTTMPHLSIAVIRLLARRLREQTYRQLEAQGLELRQRIVRAFLHSARNDNGRLIVEPVPRRQDLADAIGVRRESVSREVGRLIKCGLFRREQGRLVAEDPGLVMALADWNSGHVRL